MITINGKVYNGNNLSIVNDKVYIDGKLANDDDSKTININVEGNVDSINVDNCQEFKVIGDCGSVTSKNGNIQVKGNVSGDVTNKNGNIVCRNVGGDVGTKNGDIIHS